MATDEKCVTCEHCQQPASVLYRGQYRCGSCFLVTSCSDADIEVTINQLLTSLPPARALRIVRRLSGFAN